MYNFTDGSICGTSLNRPAAARRAPAEAARCADLLAAVEEENTLEVHLDIDIIVCEADQYILMLYVRALVSQ